MRLRWLASFILITAVACSRSDDVAPKTGIAPKDAPERATLPAKCKQALSFDDECRALFDRIWGAGAGANEAAALNAARANSGWSRMRSQTEPAATLGNQQDQTKQTTND
jgi:hypothetical protein